MERNLATSASLQQPSWVGCTLSGQREYWSRGGSARYVLQLRENRPPCVGLIVVAFVLTEVSEAFRASAGSFRVHGRDCGSPPLFVPRAHDRLHMPHTSTGLPSNSSLRWNTFSFHGFSARSKITK